MPEFTFVHMGDLTYREIATAYTPSDWDSGTFGTPVERPPVCDVYWGGHGCERPKGHDPALPHLCDCCECPDHDADPHEADGSPCLSTPGPGARLTGDDA